MELPTKGNSSGKIIAVAIATAVLTGVVLSFFDSTGLQLRSRQSYGAFDVDNDPWLSSFNQAYERARNDPGSWAEDPLDVAMRVAGYPNKDGIEPDQVSAFYENPSTVTVVIRKNKVMDDAIGAIEIRVDLKKRYAIWEIEWAGGRYRCSRSLLPGWSRGLCP